VKTGIQENHELLDSRLHGSDDCEDFYESINNEKTKILLDIRKIFFYITIPRLEINRAPNSESTIRFSHARDVAHIS
jgi:hypothetical protein